MMDLSLSLETQSNLSKTNSRTAASSGFADEPTSTTTPLTVTVKIAPAPSPACAVCAESGWSGTDRERASAAPDVEALRYGTMVISGGDAPPRPARAGAQGPEVNIQTAATVSGQSISIPRCLRSTAVVSLLLP